MIPHRSGTVTRALRTAPVLLALFVLLVAGLPPTLATQGPGATGARPTAPVASGFAGEPVAVPDGPSEVILPGSHLIGAATQLDPSAVVVYLSLALRNASRLASELQAISDPTSASYHHYLSAGQFARAFAPNRTAYDALTSYATASGALGVQAYPDRLGVGLLLTPRSAGQMFHTTLGVYEVGSVRYRAPESGPMLPGELASLVRSVAGLGSSPAGSLRAEFALSGRASVGTSGAVPMAAGGYPAPPTVGGTQLVYPTDLQIAYDEPSLLDLYGPPTNATAAMVLWSGAYGGAPLASTACGVPLATGADVGPYVPGDFSAFFNSTSPTGQAHPLAHNVPLENSTAAGCLASYDTTGTVQANTATIETLGSLLPGGSIWAVSESGASVANLDVAVQSILSPPTNLPLAEQSGLLNATVIDVGWAAKDTADAGWDANLAQATARGITIVTATGNSADDPASSAWLRSNATFPSSSATNTTGAVAVGGTTVTLNATSLHVLSEVAWNVSAADTADGGPAGSSGGVSSVYAEPSWQKTTLAHGVTLGRGRGVPDVAAIANNTLYTVSLDGRRLNATNASTGGTYEFARGTSIASAAIAGILCEIDHVLRAGNNSVLGFADPTLYAIANREYSTLPNTKTVGYIGTYSSPLPTVPFPDIVVGRNYLYRTATGYDLVTGWGSLDAYNLTMYLLSIPTARAYGELTSVQDRVNLSSLTVTTTIPGHGVNRYYNGSIQQNLFLANSMGAPVYWIQSVIYINRSATGWVFNFTGWVVFPFWGFDPNPTYEFWWPVPGVAETTPLSLNLTTTLQPGTASTPADVVFSFGTAGALTLVLAVYGASYIIGATNYTYDWQGHSYTDGPRLGSSAVAFLAPQFGFYGGPSGNPAGALGNFKGPTSGNFQAFVKPSGSLVYQPAATGPVTLSNTQTGESAANLSYTPVTANTYTFIYTPTATMQGVYEVEAPQTLVTFTETGALAGSTWYVNSSAWGSVAAVAPTATIRLSITNGDHAWAAGTSTRSWDVRPAGGTIAGNGTPMSIPLVVAPSRNTVTFTVSKPTGTLPFGWFVAVVGGATWNATGRSTTLNLTYGTYSYRVGSYNQSWAAKVRTGTFSIGARSASITVAFAIVVYTVSLSFQLPNGISPHMTVRIGTSTAKGYFAYYSVKVPNGTYSWSVSGLSGGDWAVPDHGNVTVSGAGPYIVPIRVFAPSSSGFLGLGSWGYVIVVVVPAAAAAIVFVLFRRRRRRLRRGTPTPSPAATGTSPPTTPPPKAK